MGTLRLGHLNGGHSPVLGGGRRAVSFILHPRPYMGPVHGGGAQGVWAERGHAAGQGARAQRAGAHTCVHRSYLYTSHMALNAAGIPQGPPGTARSVRPQDWWPHENTAGR